MINAIAWNSKGYGLLHRDQDQSVEAVDVAFAMRNESRALSRVLSYDLTTGRPKAMGGAGADGLRDQRSLGASLMNA